ncbi:hypothetical protein AGMMS49940_16330 [Spirochaetia bacterium]|nr:hypothetical protein AGMMS49940_16330 [Spirochaetia bacterium]
MSVMGGAIGAEGVGADGGAGGEAQENRTGRVIIRRSKPLSGRMFIFTIIILYNRLENNKSGWYYRTE